MGHVYSAIYSMISAHNYHNYSKLKSFRILDLRQMPAYPVPEAIRKSEEEKEPLALDFSVEMSRKNQSDYVKSFKTMIHLEEAAQTLFLKTFNQTNVRVYYTGSNRLFFILNEVSCCKLRFWR